MVPPAETARSKHHRFPGAMISYSVWLSYRFSLRDRDVEAMLLARGIVVTYEAMVKGVTHVARMTRINDGTGARSQATNGTWMRYC